MSLNNSQYNAIMRIYNQRQFQDKYEQDQRREEVYQKVPQIRQIEDEISSQAVRCARKLLDGDTNAKEELKQHIEDLREQKEVLLSAFGFPADYMEMHYACPECRIRAMSMAGNAVVLRKRRSVCSTPSPTLRKCFCGRILTPSPTSIMTTG